MLLHLNNKIVESKERDGSLLNRSFLYGDGLFETIIVRNGEIYFLEDHHQRMMAGMAALKMTPPEDFDFEYLKTHIYQLMILNKLVNAETVRIRVQVVRKPGGLYTPSMHETDLYIIVQPYSLPASYIKKKVVLANTVQLHYSLYSRHKTCNSLPYIMAGIERKQREADDLILTDHQGHLAECTSSNLFWLKQNEFYTPSLMSGCIEGVMRKQVILQATLHGITVKEGLFTMHDLVDASYVFSTNVTGIYPIECIENRLYNTLLPFDLSSFYLKHS
jgi:4-amino-4-deoxychorismate lyase